MNPIIVYLTDEERDDLREVLAWYAKEHETNNYLVFQSLKDKFEQAGL